ncbi:hypothetical protein M3D00_00485 [Dietzia cinnamea]|uniref:hypothetical protein n=1 Tax=Dietzia cinnamea TaxID=321318 RepID=UPI0021A6CAA9|nr:hypothetical protein [Dietzia cinnamea]MCT2028644.1 hypothetical protein [Dietzia cinnamea]
MQVAVVDSTILAHTETMRLSSAELARQLVQHLGATVVAVLAGVRDKKLPYKWASDGGPVPRDGALQRLQVAHRAWVAVATAEGADIARAWFIGANPRLEEQPPFMALADGKFKPVMSAAAAFVDGTDN